MAMTPKGIYFPEGSTNADFVSIFSTMASSIDSALGDFTYDSGWIDVPSSEMKNGWETYNSTGSRVRYRKIGKTVMVDGIARNGTDRDIFVLPKDFRPNSVYTNHAVPIISASTNTNYRAVRLRVNASTGDLQVYQTTQTTRNSGIGLSNVQFFVD